MGRVLVGCTWFVGLYIGPESMVVGNIFDLSVDPSVVLESVASVDVSVSVSVFLSVLRSVVVVYVVTELVWLWVVVFLKKF